MKRKTTMLNINYSNLWGSIFNNKEFTKFYQHYVDRNIVSVPARRGKMDYVPLEKFLQVAILFNPKEDLSLNELLFKVEESIVSNFRKLKYICKGMKKGDFLFIHIVEPIHLCWVNELSNKGIVLKGLAYVGIKKRGKK